MMKPEIGKPAPPFTASVIGGEYHEETKIQLADLIGNTVILYFYPKDNTPGCTSQACAIRDHWGEIQAIPNLKIFGVSHDSIESHQKFIQNKSLPFPLISDPDRSICKAYDVLGEKSILGKTLFNITERSSFIIDKEGILTHILEKVNPNKHLDELLEIINTQ